LAQWAAAVTLPEIYVVDVKKRLEVGLCPYRLFVF
jgi:hypothetical protein